MEVKIQSRADAMRGTHNNGRSLGAVLTFGDRL